MMTAQDENTTTAKRTRANGEGSIYHSASRGWCASITGLDGKRVVRKAPEQSRAGAKALLRRLLREREEGAVARHSMTLERHLPEFLEAARLRGCRPRSLEAFEDRLRNHVLPTLGKVRLDKLTPGQVEQLYATKLDSGLSPATINCVHQVLGALLKRPAARHRRAQHSGASRPAEGS
jgi:integrase